MEKRDDLADEAKSCSEQGNGYPLCQPVSTETWVNGSTHQIIWNYNYPYYVTSDTTSLYLYNIIKYNYVSVKNYTDIDTSQGGLQVQVDNSWFPDPITTHNQSITMYLYILPSDIDPYSELANAKSMFPRPFNFTVLQIASPSNGSTMSSSPNNTNTNANTNSSRLPSWAIAVICIAAFAILFGVIALIYAMMIMRRNKKRHGRSSIKKIITKRMDGSNKYATNDSHTHIVQASSDSMQMMQSATSVNTIPSSMVKSPSPLFFDYHQQKVQLPEDAHYMRSPFVMNSQEEEEEEEERRRRLGESLLQRQLEEDGTSVKHAGRFTRVRSVAELPKSAAMVEHPRYP